MGWIDKFKGEGPWPFIPQSNKPHYNEGNLISNSDNPIWELDHLDNNIPITPTHFPWCGYWPKEYPPIPPDVGIFVNTSMGDHSTYGVHFNGKTLSWIGAYKPIKNINGLILYEGDLMVVCGDVGTDAELRRIGTEIVGGGLPLLNTYTPFNMYDVRKVFFGRLVNGSLGKIYYSDISTVMVSLNNLVRDKRGFRNIVITGTDGNLYVLNSSIFWWEDSWHPITGDSWNALWDLIEDNICDTVVNTWGDEPIPRCSGTAVDICYYDNYLYTADFSSWVSPIRKINSTTLETEASYISLYNNRITAYGDKVYTIGGLISDTVYSYSVSDLSLLHSQSLPYGRAASNGDLEVVGDYLIVSTCTYPLSPATLYKLSLNDLTILDSISAIPGTVSGGQRLAAIDDTYVAVAFNRGVSVYNIKEMVLVDRLDSMDFDPLVGYFAQEVVVKHY